MNLGVFEVNELIECARPLGTLETDVLLISDKSPRETVSL